MEKFKSPTISEIQALFLKAKKQLDANNVEEAAEINIIAYEKALAIDAPELISQALYNFGSYEDYKGHTEQALNFYRKCRHFAVEHQVDKYVMLSYSSSAAICATNGKYRKALEAYMKALEIANQNNDLVHKKQMIYNNMGLAFFELKEYENAKKYYLDGLKITGHQEDPFIVAILYSNLAELSFVLEEYLEGLKYLEMSRSLSAEIKDHVGIAVCLGLEAVYYNQFHNNWKNAYRLFEEAVVLIKKSGSVYDQIELQVRYGVQAFIAKKYRWARQILENIIENVESHHYVMMEWHIYEVLEKVYVIQENHEKAYHYARRQLDIRSHLQNEWDMLSIENITNTLNKQAEDREVDDLKRSIQTMKMLARVGQSITASIEFDEIFEIVNQNISRILNVQAFIVGLVNEEAHTVGYKMFDEGEYRELSVPIDDLSYFLPWCIHNNQEIIIYDTQDKTTYETELDDQLLEQLQKVKMQSLLFCPMYHEGKIIGGISAQSTKRYNFSYVDLETLRLLTSYISIAITNSQKSKKLQEANRKMEELSKIDGLTRLLNRHALGGYIRNEFEIAQKEHLPISVLMIDLDFFKQYNDFYGHIQGDKCLKKISDIMKSALTWSGLSRCYAYRYGGDEFLCVIESCHVDLCKQIIEKIQTDLLKANMPHLHSKASDQVTLTIGACTLFKPVKDYTELFAKADEALYEAKGLGRNTYVHKVLE